MRSPEEKRENVENKYNYNYIGNFSNIIVYKHELLFKRRKSQTYCKIN